MMKNISLINLIRKHYLINEKKNKKLLILIMKMLIIY
jgi:hypothetical protein